jgi:hypothetical protein
MIHILGGTKQQKETTTKVVKWCLDYFKLNKTKLFIKLRPYDDCWGYCMEGDIEHSYRVTITHNQSMRDFVATIVHEMVHVKQWEKNRWNGDGEAEAERLQYKLTDKMWKEGIL